MIQIKILNQYNERDLERSYLHMRVDMVNKENGSIEEKLLEFYYPSEYIEEDPEGEYHKLAIKDVRDNLNKYLTMPKLEDMSPETISIYDEGLESSEFVVYIEIEDKDERQTIFNKMKEDIEEEHHDKFELYEDNEILLYADFITIFNLVNIDKALEKMNRYYKERENESIEDNEGLEV